MMIALAGHAGSGKDTAASLLNQSMLCGPWVSMSFAAPMKDFCGKVFGFSHAQLYGPSGLRNAEDSRFAQRGQEWVQAAINLGKYGPEFVRSIVHNSDQGVALDKLNSWFMALPNPLSARHALQTLGTEWGRACEQNLWADAGVHRAKLQQKNGFCVAFTDCRFTNEAATVRRAGGKVWRILRPSARLLGVTGAHASEVEMDSPEFAAHVDRAIPNLGTLEEFEKAVLAALADAALEGEAE